MRVASAPYLHNGSVPDLQTLLSPDSRPPTWRRATESEAASTTTVGLSWEPAASGADDAYDTSKPGLSNAGHRYGESLSDTERTALIEFMKTL
ncbi:MAG: hypothetical protein ACI9OJ_000425 [Myxococcota bacterium]|jgi:hypothetical protein